MADNINDIDYLLNWEKNYSKAETITQNDNLTNTNNEADAQKTLLNGSAKGTEEKFYLDPIPFINSAGQAYTSIISLLSRYARTDALKMNRENMDYTNNSTSEKGLNLLMPQYQRRVEVEDLDENFWVISILLDAILKALWGQYGLIQVVRELISRLRGIEAFLGLDKISGIELLHGGSNDLYFDMYSRFNLNELSIKLKTSSGERIVKDFITQTNQFRDRGTTTNAYKSRQALFNGIQKEIVNAEEQSQPALYDSDLISIENAINIGGGKNYLSLSSVLDAINNKIISDEESETPIFGDINISTDNIDEGLKKLLEAIDTDNIFTLQEIDDLKADMQRDTINSIEEFRRFMRYHEFFVAISDENGESGEYMGIKIEDLYDKKVLMTVDLKTDAYELDPIGEQFYFEVMARDRILQIKERFDEWVIIPGGDDDNLVQAAYAEDPDLKAIKGYIGEIKEMSLLFDFVDTSKYYVYTATPTSKNPQTDRGIGIYVSINSNPTDIIDAEQFTINIIDSIDIPSKMNDDGTELSPETVKFKGKTKERKLYGGALGFAIVISKCRLPSWTDPEKQTPEIKEFKSKYGEVFNEFFDMAYCIDGGQQEGPELEKAIKVSKQLLKHDDVIYYDIMTEKKEKFVDSLEHTYKNKQGQDETVDNALFFDAFFKAGKGTLMNIKLEDYETNSDYLAAVSKYLFQLIDNDLLFPKLKGYFWRPTANFFDLLKKASDKRVDVGGADITIRDEETVKQSIEDQEYGLFGNVVLYLYDKNFYRYQTSDNEEDDGTQGLYLINEDLFFTVNNPFIIRKALVENGILPLFIGRDDLFNGEILQLRLTQKSNSLNGFGDGNVLPNQIDFAKLLKQANKGSISEANMKECIVKGDEKIFLSLHNSFADVLGRYNFRTTLFFKDTTPFTSQNEAMPTSIDDWFRNGIECTYFKPKKVFSNNKITFSPYVVKKSLKIKASMIAKNAPYVENSFFIDNIVPGNYNDTVNGVKSDYQRLYSFDKKCAYFAAMRDNLIFYASPPQNEYDQFIHSPGRMLVSPNFKPHIDTIQSPRTSVTGPKESTDEWYCHDVLGKEGDVCNLEQIKDMLYRNAYENLPLQVEAIFGRRDVNNYIKKKILSYVVIEREAGTRHQLYGPTTLGLSISDGYLHSSGIKSKKEISHMNGKITWYNKKGTPIDNGSVTKNGKTVYNCLGSQGVYGAFKVNYNEPADTFMTRFYSSAITGNGKDNANIFGTSAEYNLWNKNGIIEPIRRPIFSTAYFFGIDDSGKSKPQEE